MSDHTPISRYLCIHGHFYQPPRENPWLEAIEEEESAAPFHDWNERILTECYAPNSRSRIQNDRGQITRISNNYQKISFNFGPTLLSWMDEKAGFTLTGIQKADRQSQIERDGHGNALAQAYNHIILPLAQNRDIRTQIRWGKADFQKHFNRDPEGMWLPETAVDLRTLGLLAEEGFRFTILAPHQAKRFRPLGHTQWTDVQGDINPRRPYWCNLPKGNKIALFFYDGRLAHGIAFENYLQNSELLFQQLKTGFDPDDVGPQLVHVATDGESYGHHRLFGDMALAFALQLLEEDPRVKLTNYGWFLSHFPPQYEVEIQENSSWSCAHGIERWRSDCSCRLGGPENHQGWRAPLRNGLDRLKMELDRLFEERTEGLLKDPWLARDAYIQVILERSPETLERFFQEHSRKPTLSGEERIQVLNLMEMQRCGLLMFTSCGWFFDEISGLETTQILKYACRAVQIARNFGQDPEPLLLSYLEKAPSNKKEYGNGAVVWERKVRPFQVDLNRVLAHNGISSIYEKNPKQRTYCFEIDHQDQVIIPQNGNHLAVGLRKVTSTITLEELQGIFAVFHYGGVDFQCLLKPCLSAIEYESIKKEMLALYKTGSLGDVYDWVKGSFPPRRYYLKDLFPEERQRLIHLILQEGIEKQMHIMEEWVKEDRGTLIKLAEMGVARPAPIQSALNLVLDRDLDQGIREAFSSRHHLEGLKDFFEQSQELGYPLPKEEVRQRIERRMAREMEKVKGYPDPGSLFACIAEILKLCRRFDIPLNLWDIQNNFLDAGKDLPAGRQEVRDAYLSFAREIDIPPEVIEREIP
ncbi:MAG: DUF3536 domain-containing protein [Thermodesulfobacteriota bacterium]